MISRTRCYRARTEIQALEQCAAGWYQLEIQALEQCASRQEEQIMWCSTNQSMPDSHTVEDGESHFRGRRDDVIVLVLWDEQWDLKKQRSENPKISDVLLIE